MPNIDYRIKEFLVWNSKGLRNWVAKTKVFKKRCFFFSFSHLKVEFFLKLFHKYSFQFLVYDLYWFECYFIVQTEKGRYIRVGRGEEGQPHHTLVRTTFSSFSRPNHLEILVLSILFFLSVRSLKINSFFKNMATLGHKTWLE